MTLVEMGNGKAYTADWGLWVPAFDILELDSQVCYII